MPENNGSEAMIIGFMSFLLSYREGAGGSVANLAVIKHLPSLKVTLA